MSSVDETEQVTGFTDLPDVIIQHILHLIHDYHGLHAACRAACVCKILHRAFIPSLGLCTYLRPPPNTSKAFICAAMPHMHALASLDLSGSFRWVDDAVAAAVAGVESLTSLTLDHCSRLTAVGIAALCSGRLRHLRALSLHRAGGVGDGAVLSSLPSLNQLDLAWGVNVQGQALVPCGDRLRSLSLHGCELVDNSLCYALHQVEDLDLAFTRVGNAGLLALAAGSPRLQRLVLAAMDNYNLWATGLWNESGLHEFKRLRPEVALVFVSC